MAYPIFVFMKKNPENILLVAATAKEISPFLQSLKDPACTPGSVPVDVLISGVGLTATAYHLTSQLQLKKYGLVIQAGVAGCFHHKIKTGQVLIVAKDTIADQSVEELNQLKTLFDLKLVPQNQFPFRQGWLTNPYKKLIRLTGLKPVNGISVNQISVSGKMIDFYKKKFHPVTESMEGAALHYVCLMKNIPFIQLRSISNVIGERNKKKWNMKEAVIHLNNELIRIISILS